MSAVADPSRYTPAQVTRRDRVIDAAYELLLSTPYDGIQMKEISEESGVALATVYRYFSSKEYLFVLVLSRWVERFSSRVHHRPLRGATNEERLVDAFTRAIRAFGRVPQFFATFGVVGHATDPETRAALEGLGGTLEATYASALEGLDPATVTTIIFAANAVMNGLLREWSRGDLSIDEVCDRMAATIALLVRGGSL